MPNKINLKEIEKKAYTSFHQDGLIDVFAGLVFILYGIVMLTNNAPFLGLCWLPAILIWPLKKKITVPRMGFVVFSETRKLKLTKAGLITLITGIVAFLFILSVLKPGGLFAYIDNYAILLVGLLAAVPPLAGAFFTGIKRFYLYAILFFSVFAGEQFFIGTAPFNFLIFGIILFCIGIFVLVQFIKKYPKSGKEMFHDNKNRFESN